MKGAMTNKYTNYTDNKYDEMKSLLQKSRRLFEHSVHNNRNNFKILQ